MGSEVMQKEFPDQKQRYAVCMQRHEGKKMKHNEASLSANWATEKWHGRDYIVAPATILVEGVHNELFYPADEMKKTAHLWNGVPLVVQHPVSSDGIPISANSPDVYAAQKVGRLFHVMYDNKKLKGKVYVEKDKMKQFPELAHYLEKDLLMEISTGLFSDDEMYGGVWQGKKYRGIVRNHKPDHLALLPGGVGACSGNDGCGIRVNSAGKALETYRRKKRVMRFNAALATDIFINRK